MSEDRMLARVTAEIEALHRYLEGWFRGGLDARTFEPDFVERFDAAFLLIPPAGTVLTREDVARGIRAGRAGNPAFRIAIRAVVVRRVDGERVLATYEEWQKAAKASSAPDNARRASVWFHDDGERLRWLHLHETWLPVAEVEAGGFDFEGLYVPGAP